MIMASENSKKLSIIYILKILQEYTDQNHFLTQNEIANKMNLLYGIKNERKSIGYNISSLIDIGYDIVKLPKGGYFLNERDFESSEISYLIDAVFSSKTISSTDAKNLVKKLSSFLSKYDRKKYNYLYKSNEINRVNNKQVFYNIDVINQAIEEKKQLRFIYNKYGIDKKLVPRQGGRDYLVNPYFMINSNGRYYLVCNYDWYDGIANYKIELITNIEIVENPTKPITQVKNYENGIDIAKYINENIYLFGGKTITAKIKLENENAVNDIVDWFGNNANIAKINNDIVATIKSSRLTLYYWCLQYSEATELLEPQDLRQKLKETINKISKKYK